MKKKLTTILATLMIFAMALTTAGCGKPTLDEWYNDNKAEFDEIIEAENANADQFRTTTDIRVEDSNVLLYSKTLLDEVPTDETSLQAIANLYDRQYASKELKFTEWLARMQEETSTRNLSIRYVVFNSDGTTVLYSKDFTQ